MTSTPHLVYRLLEELETAKIHYDLHRLRDDSIMILAQVPGSYYEIEVFPDERVEVEVFKSDGQIGGQEVIAELFANYSERE